MHRNWLVSNNSLVHFLKSSCLWMHWATPANLGQIWIRGRKRNENCKKLNWSMAQALIYTCTCKCMSVCVCLCSFTGCKHRVCVYIVLTLSWRLMYFWSQWMRKPYSCRFNKNTPLNVVMHKSLLGSGGRGEGGKKWKRREATKERVWHACTWSSWTCMSHSLLMNM